MYSTSDGRVTLPLQLALASVLALAPIAILPRQFFYFDVTPKVAILLIGTAIGLLFFLRTSMLVEISRVWADPLGRSFCLLASAQLISLLASTALSSNPALSWNGGNWRRFGLVSQSAVIVFAFLIAASRSEPGFRIFLRAATAAGMAAALYGILQYFGVDPFLPSTSYHIGEGVMAIVRPPSTLGHADYFAGYLLYSVFFGAALLASEIKLPWKSLGGIAIVAGSLAIALSGTRSALLGLAAGGASLWVWNRSRFASTQVISLATICVVGVLFYFSPAGLKLRARGHWASEDLRGGARLWLWRDSLRMADRRLLAGFGPETFGLDFPRYQSVELSRAYPDFYHESPHNIFLDALVSQGIPGLVILVGFVAVGWLSARRAVLKGRQMAPYLAAALIAGVTANLFVCFTLTGALYFYATAAMLVGCAIPVTRSTPSLALRAGTWAP